MKTVVRCGNCDRVLEVSPSTAANDRAPCPDCGSTRRTFEGSATLAMRLVASVVSEIHRTYYERSLPWLLVLAAVTIASGLVGGFVLTGWPSVASAFVFSLVSFVVGLRAVSRVRSVERA